MKNKSLVIIGALLAALLMSGALTIHADSSGNVSEFNFYILILGIIEDPDPIPTITYKMREVLDDPSLDMGELRNDGRPDTAVDLERGWPVVTWAYGAGNDYDIAFSCWTGEDWSGTEFLTSSPHDELDPRAYIDSFRKTYIIWWRAGSPDKVFLTTRGSGAPNWKEQIQVVNNGRRPSVVTHDDWVIVAFERSLDGGGQEVVIAHIADDGSITTESVASTSRSERLDAVIHSSGGLLWVDWKHSDSEFAYSILEGAGWSDPVTLSWADDNWIGEESVRRIIKTEVLSP